MQTWWRYRYSRRPIPPTGWRPEPPPIVFIGGLACAASRLASNRMACSRRLAPVTHGKEMPIPSLPGGSSCSASNANPAKVG